MGAAKPHAPFLWYASETKSNSNASVLLLDADFRGSALQWLLFENPSGTKPESYHHLLDTFQGKISNSAGKRKGTEMHHRFALPENFLPSKNLNQYIMGNCITMEDILFKSFSYEKLTTKLPEDSDEPAPGGSTNETQDGIITPDIFEELGINGYIDFIFSASDFADKALFRYAYNEGKYKMPAITPGIYIYRIAMLIQQIMNHGKPSNSNSGQYKNIIIDMPPGDDEYSDLLLRELRNAAKKNSNLKLHYYAVTTNDIGHMHLAVEKVKDIIANNSSYLPFESVNVILNCLLADADFPFGEDLDPDAIANITKIQKHLSAKGDLLRQGHVEAYHKFCRSSKVGEFECDTSQAFTKVAVAGNQLKNM